MRIDEKNGLVTFDRLIRADRSLGSDEAITIEKPATKAVAANARGVFAQRTLGEIHAAAMRHSSSLRAELLAK